MDTTTSPRIVVCVPTYNEAENLPILAERLLALEPEVQVLVVDDSSPDGTGELADALAADNDRVHVVHRTEARGFANACRAAMAWALAHDADYVQMMDADMSHDPKEIPILVATAERTGADLVIGSRYIPGGGLEVDWGWFRRAVSESGSAYARAMLGTKVRDCTGGYRCYRGTSLRAAHVEETTSAGYFFQIETLSRILGNGGEVVEVPITYVDRQRGQSKINNGIVLEAFWLTTKLGVRRLFAGS